MRARAAAVAALVAAVAVPVALIRLLPDNEPSPRAAAGDSSPDPTCGTPKEVLRAVARGYYPERSGDVLMIERRKNQYGTRHSSPWPYTQEVPMVLWGPGYVKRGYTTDRHVTLADVAPTFADLLGFDGLDAPDGSSLQDALVPRAQRRRPPRLIVTIVWDGGGDNVLERWPDSWPHLARLMRGGANFTEATVGSSPSITPAVHATLGTGAFPSTHGITDISIHEDGAIHDAWPDLTPRFLEIPTLADLWDQYLNNEPLVGIVARDGWHLGMLGHGAALEGGDHDIAVLDDQESLGFTTNPELFELPEGIDMNGLPVHVSELDLADGRADSEWLGNTLIMDGRIRETPAWNPFQTDIVEKVLRGGFGTDNVPDLFFTNYKSTDLAGHTWNMLEPEVRDDLASQDEQLPRLIGILDEIAGRGRYVILLTADHGMTPDPKTQEGWNIDTPEMTADIERAFDRDGDDVSLVLENRGYGIVLERSEAADLGVTAAQVARFLGGYTIEDNKPRGRRLPERSRGHEDETLFLAALTPKELKGCLRS